MTQELTRSQVWTSQEEIHNALKMLGITVPAGTEIGEVCITTGRSSHINWYDTKNPDGSTVRHLL